MTEPVTARASLLEASAFVGLEGVAHLCAGGEAPWLRTHDEACRQFGALKSAGMAGREAIFQVANRARAGVSRLLGAPLERVAFLAHASEGLNAAVDAVAWRPGDNVVVADLEFPSGIYAAGRLRDRGVEPRMVNAREHYLAIDDLVAAVDARTRLIIVSQVSYLTGQRVDLARLAELARSRGALLAVDATHALGVAPVDAELCDFVVSSCYKWLLATHGVGVFAYDPTRVGDVVPSVVGWASVANDGAERRSFAPPLRADARRFEAGNPSLLGLFVLDNALRALESFEARTVLEHVHSLGDLVLEGLRRRGRTVVTPAGRAERAGNVCFLADDADALAARLAERRVLVWGSEGRVRVSVHLYNDAGDVAAFFDALDGLD